jgi:GxxExxY protein
MEKALFVDNALVKKQHIELTDRIIGVFYTVYNTLGYGFLEKCYEKALLVEFAAKGLQAQGQVPLAVYYRGETIGNFFADIVVENTVILELKTAIQIAPEHKTQLLNYLRATEIEVGLLFNFGIEPQVVRKAFSNTYKKSIHTNLAATTFTTNEQEFAENPDQS